jgi:hypothetical protein
VPAAGSIRAAISINILDRRMKSSPIGFIDQTRVDANIVATNRVARKPPKPDLNRLEAPEQIIVEFAPRRVPATAKTLDTLNTAVVFLRGGC